MWTYERTEQFEKRLKKWPKKHHRELQAMLEHLQTIYEALCLGAKVEHLRYGFVHQEPGGMLALDQKGAGAGVKQTRLYVYPDPSTKILHVIALGDKDSQSEDIAYCTAYVQGILNSGKGTNDG